MDVKGQRVLIFGDSLTARSGASVQVDVTEGIDRRSSSPGDLLASQLLAAGAAAARINARVGRSAWNFWQREEAAKLIAADLAWQPTIVFVMLGTNDIGLNLTKDRQALERIRDAYATSGAQLVGIGPPAFSVERLVEGSPGVVAMHRKVFGPDRVVDARPLSRDLLEAPGRAGDHVHFTAAGAAALAPRLAAAIAGLPAAPRKGAPWKPLGIGFGLTLGLGALIGGMVWVSRRREQLAPPPSVKQLAAPAPKPGSGWVSASDGKPPKLVAIGKLYVSPRKMGETIIDVREGRISHSKYEPIVVSRLDSGDFYVMDGHHRLLERINDGEKKLPIVFSNELPRIEHTGGAYATMLAVKQRAVDLIRP